MEKKKIGNFRSRNARQRISGFLASVLVFVFVFEQFFMSLSYAATAGNLASASDAVRSGKVTWKNSGADDIQLAVLSDEALYEAGDQVCLDVYIKNNTDREIYDGLLKFKAGGILEDSVYFEDIGTIYQESREDGESEDGISEDGTFESGNSEEGDTSGGSASEEGGAGELSYTVSKPIAGEDAGDDEEMMDGGDEEEDLSRVTDMILEPGEIRYVQFYFTIDDEIEGNKSQNIKFSFSGKADGRPVSTKETFRYVVGAMNLLPVEVGNEGKVAAGETARMQLDFELGEIEDVIMEREMELGISHNATFAKIDVASASDASASDADREDDGDDGSDDNSGNKLIKWDGEKADSGKKEDQPVIKNLKCTFDTKGVALNGFKVEKQGDDEYGTSVICTFGVDENAEPGIYFGQLNASYRIKSKDYQSSQGIMIEVTNDGFAQAVDPVARVSALIREKLPSLGEMEEKFDALEEAGDDEGYAQYIAELCEIAMPIYEEYMALTPEQQEQVEGREVLLTIASFWEADTMAVNTTEVTVTNVNKNNDNKCRAIIARGEKGKALINGTSNIHFTHFRYWNVVIVELDDKGQLVVKKVINNEDTTETGKSGVYDQEPVLNSDDKGFLLLWHTDIGNVKAKVGDLVEVSNAKSVDFWKTDSQYDASGYAKLNFASPGTKTNIIAVTNVNKNDSYDCRVLVAQGSKGKNIINNDSRFANFRDWNAAVIEKDTDTQQLMVRKVIYDAGKLPSDRKKNRAEVLNEAVLNNENNEDKGFILLWHYKTWDLDIKAGDVIEIPHVDAGAGGAEFWKEELGYKAPVTEKGIPRSHATLRFHHSKPGTEGIYSFSIPRANSAWSGSEPEKNPENWGHPALDFNGKWNQEEMSGNKAGFSFHLVGANEPTLDYAVGRMSGDIAYCIEPGVHLDTLLDGKNPSVGEDNEWWNSDQYSKTNLTGEQIKTLVGRVIAEGYSGKTGTNWTPGDKDAICEAIATQLLVWEVVVGERNANFEHLAPESGKVPVKSILSGTGYSNPWKETIDQYYDQIESAVKAFNNVTALSLSVGEFIQSAGDGTWKAELVLENQDGTPLVELTGYDVSFVVTGADGKPSNRETVSNNGVTFTISGDKKAIIADKLPEEGNAEVNVEVNRMRAGLVVWSSETQQDLIYSTGKTKDGLKAEGKAVIHGNRIEITKTDAKGVSLKDVEFTLYKDNSSETRTIISDENGKVVCKGLGAGQYTLKETQPREGYLLSTDEISFTVGTDGKISGVKYNNEAANGPITVKNVQSTKVSVEKAWEETPEEYKPESIEVELYQNDTVISTGTLAAPGWKYEFNSLPKEDENGVEYKYQVKETQIKYPEGSNYAIDPAKSSDGIFTIVSTKPDETGHVLGVFKFKDETPGAEEIDGNFSLKISNTWIPAVDKETFDFFIKKVNGDAEGELKPGLAGAVFELRKKAAASGQSDEVIATAISAEDGMAAFSVENPKEKLNVDGQYYVVEVQAPEGFQKIDRKWDVVMARVWVGVELSQTVENQWVNEWKWTAKIEGNDDKDILAVENHRIKGNIRIAKKLNLDGTEGYRDDKSYSFAILDKDQNPVIGSDGNPIVLDVKADGIPVQTSEMLDYGDYIIVETQKDNIEEHIWEKVEFEGTDAEGKPVGSSETVKGNAGFRIKVDGHGKTVNVIATNYYSRKVVTIEGEKTWSDLQAISERGLLPQSIGLDLMRKVKDSEEDAEPVAHQTITAEDGWKYSFADQPQYADGEGKVPYVYSVIETEINYGEAGSESAPYTVEPFGKDMFKVSRKESNNGFYEVLGVFKVTYSEPEVETNGDHTSYKIVVNNTWQVASVENQGNAYLEITKNDSQDKKPLADAVFELKVGDVTLRRRTDKEGRLTFGTDGKTASGQEDETYFERLPEGTYEMTEAEAPEGYQKLDTIWTVTVSKKLVGVTQTAENPAVWINVWEWTTDVEGDEEITNQFAVENDRIQGRISIAKALVLDGKPDTSPDDQEKEYTFGIYQGTVFTGTPVETLTVKADGSVETSGLLDYGVYTINELRRSDVEGYQWVSVTFSGVEDADKDAAGFQVIVAEQDAVLAVTATNRYDREEEETTTTGEEETTTEPESSTEESTTSEESQPESSTEESTTSEESQPESSTEESTAPEESQPESSTEESTAPEESTTSGENQPESSTEESTAPEETTAPAPVRGGGSGNGGGGGGGRDRDRNVTETVADENVPLANIDPEDVPLANLPNEPVTETPLEILDEDVPLVGLAKTGDRSVPVGALVGLMVISLLSALGISRRRKEDENS